MNNRKQETSSRIGVVLVNWNSDEVTIPCVESLQRGSRPPDLIVVVDNASRPGSIERIIEYCPSVHVIRNSINYGFTGGNNIGLAYLIDHDFDYAWILNNDTEVARDCLAALSANLDDDDDIAAVTGKIYYYGTDNLLWFAGATFNRFTFSIGHRGMGEIDKGQYDTREKIDYFDGCCLLVRCNVLRRVGLFDEHFFAYNEDLDLSFRLQQQNLQIIYDPKAILYHKIGTSISKNTQQSGLGGTSTPLMQFLAHRNRIYIARRYANPLQLSIAIVSLLLNALIISPVMMGLGRSLKVKAIWAGIYHGLCNNISTVLCTPASTPYR